MADIFDGLSEEWFQKYGIEDPVIAFPRWKAWLAHHGRLSGQAKYRKVLEIATGLGEGAIWRYREKPWRLSAWMVRVLDTLTEALGFRLPKLEERAREKRTPRRPGRGGRHIALLTELADLPSPPYHLEVIRSIIRAGRRHNHAVALHEVSPGKLTEAVEHVVRVCLPDAVVMLRITPEPRACELLEDYGVPAVLVHADRYVYPCPPVLANVAPQQDRIDVELWSWVQEHLGDPASATRRKATRKGPVLVAMPREQPERPYPLKEGVDPSVRNERIDRMWKVVKAYGGTLKEVPDYSFRHAKGVFKEHGRAAAYVCLCDTIAVALLHLTEAAGRRGAPIVGFDNSGLAELEGLDSFGQALEQIGKKVADKLADWFKRPKGREGPEEEAWPEFEHLTTDVRLFRRQQRGSGT
jgi:DNA-binding LacI/PurR family transcriptional regulator